MLTLIQVSASLKMISYIYNYIRMHVSMYMHVLSNSCTYEAVVNANSCTYPSCIIKQFQLQQLHLHATIVPIVLWKVSKVYYITLQLSIGTHNGFDFFHQTFYKLVIQLATQPQHDTCHYIMQPDYKIVQLYHNCYNLSPSSSLYTTSSIISHRTIKMLIDNTVTNGI